MFSGPKKRTDAVSDDDLREQAGRLGVCWALGARCNANPRCTTKPADHKEFY